MIVSTLANGKTETWVSDRTGHTSSAMIQRYKRKVRMLGELKLGKLTPLNEAIPELSDDPPQDGADES